MFEKLNPALWISATAVAILLVVPLAFGSAIDAKKAFTDNRCATCHDVSWAGIEATTKMEKMKGPDLTGVGERHKADLLVRFIKKEEKIEGKDHKLPFKGSDEELQAIIDWLIEQK